MNRGAIKVATGTGAPNGPAAVTAGASSGFCAEIGNGGGRAALAPRRQRNTSCKTCQRAARLGDLVWQRFRLLSCTPRRSPSMHDPTASKTHEGAPARRNLLVCCDGTGNILGNAADTNVVKLVRRSYKGPEQLVYYDPGVGTANAFPAVGVLEELFYRLKLVFGLAFGSGVYENIAQAYQFLVQNYRAGDRIFLFGFSRGAFTVRAVSGLIHLFGLVRPSAVGLLPLLLRTYFSDPGPQRDAVADDLRRHFTDDIGERADVHFIGVWDTVSTVGGLFGRRKITSDPSLSGKAFRHVRHALAAGEYRAAYEPRIYLPADAAGPPSRNGYVPSLTQVWFPGAHSDVGGSYPESGLSDGALKWMLDELAALGDDGILLDGSVRPLAPDALARAHDQALSMPLWALLGLERRAIESGSGPPHPSLALRMQAGSARIAPPRAGALKLLAASFVAMSVIYAGVVQVTAHLGVPGANATRLAWLQLSAPWASEAELASYVGKLAPALGLDLLLIASYTVFLCVCSVFAVRALRPVWPRSARFHGGMRKLLQYGLSALVAGDLLENLLTCWAFAPAEAALRWLLMAASAGKWAGLAALVLGLLLSLALRLFKGSRSRPAG
jgi:uncharacterized protein (DUF2235 family)